MAISSSAFGTLNKAISAYTDENYTRAKKLVSTEIVGSDASINANGEDFIGQVRFYKPLGAYAVGGTNSSEDVSGSADSVVNVATQDENYGGTTNISTEVNTYIKTVRTHGANEYLVQQVISGESGIAKIARDFSETRSEDEDQALRACIDGVAAAEKGKTVSGATTFADFWQGNAPETAVEAKRFGYCAVADATVAVGDDSLIQPLVDPSNAVISQRVKHIIKAMGAWSDYAPDFVYLVCAPDTYLDIKLANIVDDERVTDGNVSFETLLGGAVRLIVSRNAGKSTAVASGVAASGIMDNESTARSYKTSFMMLPGSVYRADMSVANPVAIERNEGVGSGSGRTTAWYRWGYVMHPRGYHFSGTTTAFASNATLAAGASWTRTSGILNLGILPIIHA
jgi:hypothetical protein